MLTNRDMVYVVGSQGSCFLGHGICLLNGATPNFSNVTRIRGGGTEEKVSRNDGVPAGDGGLTLRTKQKRNIIYARSLSSSRARPTLVSSVAVNINLSR